MIYTLFTEEFIYKQVVEQILGSIDILLQVVSPGFSMHSQAMRVEWQKSSHFHFGDSRAIQTKGKSKEAYRSWDTQSLDFKLNDGAVLSKYNSGQKTV